MINSFSWKNNNQVFNVYKLIDPKYFEIENISLQFNIDIDILMESYDLEQYPFIQILNDNILNTVVDLPIMNENINIFSIPIHMLLIENNIIIICKLASEEINLLDEIVEDEANTSDAFFAILNYISSLYLIKLRNLKKNLDKIMHQVYIDSQYDNKQEAKVLTMSIELNHYMSSLETNNMVIKQIESLMKLQLNSTFYNMKLDSIQAYDIAKLYLKLNRNLFEYFKLRQEKIVSKKLNRLTTLTVSLTIPNIVFGFYGMNVNLPFASIAWVWIAITLSVMIISIIIFKWTKVDK